MRRGLEIPGGGLGTMNGLQRSVLGRLQAAFILLAGEWKSPAGPMTAAE
jgi:hypothetical protein